MSDDDSQIGGDFRAQSEQFARAYSLSKNKHFNSSPIPYVRDIYKLQLCVPPRVRKVWVVCGHQSLTKDDFRSVFRFGQLFMVKEIRVSIREPDDIARGLSRVPNDPAAVAVVHRGGGDAAAFDHPTTIKAIIDCPIPVITAIGHHGEVYVADRVAAASMQTPTLAGKLLSDLMFAQWERDKKPQSRRHPTQPYSRPRPAAERVLNVRPAASPTTRTYQPPLPSYGSAPRYYPSSIPQRQQNSWGLASLIMGIASVFILGGIGAVPLIGLICGLVGVFRRPRGMAIAGLIINSVVLAIWTVVVVIVMAKPTTQF